MEQASAILDVVGLVLSTDDDDGSGHETAVGRRHHVDEDGAARGSTPPNDVDLTRNPYHDRRTAIHSAALLE